MSDKPDTLAEMWRELEAYQPMADRDGHGESWRRMCRERTALAAGAAAHDALSTHAWAAIWAAQAAGSAADVVVRTSRAIDAIRRAKEEVKP